MEHLKVSFRRFLEEMTEKKTIRRLFQYLIYMFLMLVMQNMVLVHIHPLQIYAFVLPSAVVAVGMFESALTGALFGLVLGIFSDMFFIESAILYTVLFPFLAFAANFVSEFYINRRFFAYMITALAAGLITGAFQMLRVMVTDSFALSMFRIVILQVVWTIPFSVLAYLPPASWKK